MTEQSDSSVVDDPTAEAGCTVSAGSGPSATRRCERVVGRSSVVAEGTASRAATAVSGGRR
ncbi:hypothetical protein [Nocardia otitidiscaviarum]|uniref:hypothetical protein n=1 Tax=Nocardia otitidiscaviarum TaxID=1823 RepID=UPI0024567DC4|nr:hypothetical protein [Nocardia otitidiscaviarum]